MIERFSPRYPAFDRPEICRALFYPRRESEPPEKNGFEELTIPVDKDISVGGRLYVAAKANPTFLFFHGNGEIVADYGDMGITYRELGINFLPVDYRGYGRSTGMPTLTAIMRDGLSVFEYMSSWLVEQGFVGPIVVMGRSLGSAPALQIAFYNEERIDGLIIESGFAYIIPLLNLLGIDAPDLSEAEGPQNLEKIKAVKEPTLIIHAQYDQIIPFGEGEELYRTSGAADKTFIGIKGAGHNDIFFRGMNEYLHAIGNFSKKVSR
jgi:fermentation-respiration switch protein FrsA (DUF1100 family)